MLIQVPIPAYVGQGSPWGNVGDMKNSGLEFELGWKQVVNDFKYHISANASYAKNILVNLGNATGETILESAGASGVGSYVKGKNEKIIEKKMSATDKLPDIKSSTDKGIAEPTGPISIRKDAFEMGGYKKSK